MSPEANNDGQGLRWGPLRHYARPTTTAAIEIRLTVAGRTFDSRLLVGTGTYRTTNDTVESIAASGTGIVTVALRRIDFDEPSSRFVRKDLDWSRYTVLPNTSNLIGTPA